MRVQDRIRHQRISILQSSIKTGFVGVRFVFREQISILQSSIKTYIKPYCITMHLPYFNSTKFD